MPGEEQVLGLVVRRRRRPKANAPITQKRFVVDKRRGALIPPPFYQMCGTAVIKESITGKVFLFESVRGVGLIAESMVAIGFLAESMTASALLKESMTGRVVMGC